MPTPKAALDSAMASMALGVGGDADWQQQLQLAASAHGGDWTGSASNSSCGGTGTRHGASDGPASSDDNGGGGGNASAGDGGSGGALPARSGGSRQPRSRRNKASAAAAAATAAGAAPLPYTPYEEAMALAAVANASRQRSGGGGGDPAGVLLPPGVPPPSAAAALFLGGTSLPSRGGSDDDVVDDGGGGENGVGGGAPIGSGNDDTSQRRSSGCPGASSASAIAAAQAQIVAQTHAAAAAALATHHHSQQQQQALFLQQQGGEGAHPSPSQRQQQQPLPADVGSLQARVRDLEAENARLRASLDHYRASSAAVQARYALFNPELARPARRVYIGGLPMGATEAELRAHFNSLLALSGAAAAPGAPITACRVYPERAYAFLEFRSVEEASNTMALDGVPFRGSRLRIRRPNNYDSAAAALLGPTDPDPSVDASRLGAVRTSVSDGPDKVFVGGLPCDWDADRVKRLLAPYGRLAAFNLVMDKSTGNSKGYAFCEFADGGSADYCIASLHGSAVGPKFLTVKRALEMAGLFSGSVAALPGGVGGGGAGGFSATFDDGGGGDFVGLQQHQPHHHPHHHHLG